MCVEKSVNKVLNFKKTPTITCSCEDPKLVKMYIAEGCLPAPAVPVALAQEGRKWNLILVFPMEQQGKPHSYVFGSVSTELAALGIIWFVCFGLMFGFLMV